MAAKASSSSQRPKKKVVLSDSENDGGGDDDDDADGDFKGNKASSSSESEDGEANMDESDDERTRKKDKSAKKGSKAPPARKTTKSAAPAKGKGKAAAAEKDSESLFAQFSSPGKKESDIVRRITVGVLPGGKAGLAGSNAKYTPLEKQVMQFKIKYPGVLLLIEVGYKFRFFGEDAEIAAKILNVMAWEDKNFMTASIPTHRLRVHVGRLVAAGYKVGVITQAETAALKAAGAGSSKTGPFERKLTALYTKSTMVDDIELEPGEDFGSTFSSTKCLMAIYEVAKSTREEDQDKVTLAVVAVQPSTGDIVYDEFMDGRFRAELETRVLHLQPSELLLPPELSKPTEKLISFVVSQSIANGDEIRLERTGRPFHSYDDAFTNVSKFYEGLLAKATPSKAASTSAGETSSKTSLETSVAASLFGKAISSPRLVIVALSAMIDYLREFALDSALQLTQNFSSFSSRHHMLLNGNTLSNLEILCNDTDYTQKGSLLWVLDHTVTSFGKRTLKKWVTKPLVDAAEITRRLEAVEELRHNDSTWVKMMDALLQGLPDLERGLSRIHYKKSTAKEAYSVLGALRNISQSFPIVGRAEIPFKSDLICELIQVLPSIKEDVSLLYNALSKKAVEENKLENLFADSTLFPQVEQYKNVSLLSLQQH